MIQILTSDLPGLVNAIAILVKEPESVYVLNNGLVSPAAFIDGKTGTQIFWGPTGSAPITEADWLAIFPNSVRVDQLQHV